MNNNRIGKELSPYNKEVLVEFGKELYQNIQGSDGVNFEPDLWDFCKSLIPNGLSSKLIGQQLAKEFIDRFGKPVTNEAVNGVVKKVLQPDMAKSHTLGALVKKQFTQVPKLLIGEAMKWSINSKAMPVIKSFCTAVGGWGLPALCILVEKTCDKYLKQPKHLEKLPKLQLQSLFQFDAMTGRLKDTFGNVLTNEDIRDIKELVYQYHLTSQLLELNKEEVHQFISGYISLEEKTLQKDGVIAMIRVYIEALIRWCTQSSKEPYVYRDGQALSSEEIQDMKGAVRLLTNHNPTRKKKEIINLIKGIATHISPIQDKN